MAQSNRERFADLGWSTGHDPRFLVAIRRLYGADNIVIGYAAAGTAKTPPPTMVLLIGWTT